MSWLKKFTRNKKRDGKDHAVSSDELVENTEAAGEEEVTTALSLHPGSRVNDEEKYYYQFLNKELSPLKRNQLSLAGINLEQDEKSGAVAVTAFVRSSLKKPVTLGKTFLLLLSPEGERLARKEFDLAALGELPAESSRPWQFMFEAGTVEKKDMPSEDWQLAFELKPKEVPHRLELDEKWEQSLAVEEQEKLASFVKQTEPPKPGEVNFLGLQQSRKEDGSLHVTLLIRNGSQKNIQLEQLPLVIEDAQGDVVAKGGFKLGPLSVSANTSKPWTFIFPAEMVKKPDADFSRWKAYPPKQ
ncbi:accessory Sec system S-layer assembly protein [Jeotgalibacillus terrae]|uniref:Accessory Sec system S-layer assembly protein n=1 Tax=Jeotgalibacillus terrae TaxID=587735 RepID=A0ABW5ZDI7_9BACL|nr:accessory Sec system S-layer assembly protein [Jeotgalibacillus terrae]MBM7577883.1 accessory Sec system S-layer assembly protein [Jeotgalibacillus terrae]